jgi:hypothetical protein
MVWQIEKRTQRDLTAMVGSVATHTVGRRCGVTPKLQAGVGDNTDAPRELINNEMAFARIAYR